MIANDMVTFAPILSNLLLGFMGLFLVMYTNVFFGRRAALYYEIQARIRLNKNHLNGVINQFFLAIMLLALIQVIAILIWAGALSLLGLVADPLKAILFTGSCYLTIGFIDDILPEGWKFLALFIALSGLFSIALSTATMLNMMPLFRQAWIKKHASQIHKLMIHHNIKIPGVQEIDETLEITTK